MPTDEAATMTDPAPAGGDEDSDAGALTSFSALIDYRRWSWPFFFLVATAGALLGGAFLLLAIQGSNPLLGLVGAAIATVAAWGTTEYASARWHDHDDPSQPADLRRWLRRLTEPWRLTIVASLGLAGVVLAVAEITRIPLVGFVGLMLLAVGLGPALHWIHSGRPARARTWTIGGSLVAAVGVPLLATGSALAGAGLLGLGLLGLGLLAIGRGLAGESADGEPGPMRLGWTAAGAAAVAVPTGLFADVAILTGLGVLAALVAMMALAADIADDRVDRLTRIALPTMGAVLVALAGWFLWATGIAGDSISFLVFVVAFVTLAGASVVWRTAVVFGAVVIGFVFLWTLTASTVADDAGVSSSGDATASGVVALGDSYISGEGADEFFEGTDQKGDLRNECRRAPTAYPLLVASGVGGDPTFAVDGLTEPGVDVLTCSGATTDNVYEPAAGDDPGRTADRLDALPCRPDDDRVLASYPCGPTDQYGWDRQLASLPPDRSATQLVLLSIGGNDARFGEVVSGCLVPGSCAERREVWLDQLDALGLRLEETYRTVRAEFERPDGSAPAIVVMPYPLVMTEERCPNSPFLASEHEFVVEFTTALDQQIEAAAARAGVHYFGPGIFSFDGHRVCEGSDQAINLIDLQPTDGPLPDRLDPGSWTHNSMHPNELGHRLIAEKLVGWLNDEEILSGDGPANPVPVEPGTADPQLLDLRAARTFAVDPSTAAALREGLGAECDSAAIRTFASRIQVFDEATEDARSPAPRVPLAGADPSAVVCATGSDGTWRVLRPDQSPDADDAAPVEGRPRAALESDGTVFLRGGRPADACEEPGDADTEVCRYQWVLYRSPSVTTADGTTDDPVWQLVTLDYCTVDPACADSIDEWSRDQLRTAATIVVPAVTVVFFGGWLLALGLAVNRRRALGVLATIQAALTRGRTA